MIGYQQYRYKPKIEKYSPTNDWISKSNTDINQKLKKTCRFASTRSKRIHIITKKNNKTITCPWMVIVNPLLVKKVHV